MAPAGASTVPTYNSRLHDDLAKGKIAANQSERLRMKAHASFFCIIAIFVAIVLNVGCHGFKFSSPMFSFTANSENGKEIKTDSPTTTQPD